MTMDQELENWRTQIRKGYLELCILALIASHERMYGFEILEHLSQAELAVKEGTLYPLLNRMASEAWLKATWEMEEAKGHPRKFYHLTAMGNRVLEEMTNEFFKMQTIFLNLKKERV